MPNGSEQRGSFYEHGRHYDYKYVCPEEDCTSDPQYFDIEPKYTPLCDEGHQMVPEPPAEPPTEAPAQ